MVDCFMRPGDFDIFLNPYNNPNDFMIDCSMRPGDFDIVLKPYKKPEGLNGKFHDMRKRHALVIWYVEATCSG